MQQHITENNGNAIKQARDKEKVDLIMRLPDTVTVKNKALKLSLILQNTTLYKTRCNASVEIHNETEPTCTA